MEAAKHLPSIRMQSSPSRDLDLMSVQGGSTIFKNDSRLLGATYSKSVLGDPQLTEFS